MKGWMEREVKGDVRLRKCLFFEFEAKPTPLTQRRTTERWPRVGEAGMADDAGWKSENEGEDERERDSGGQTR